MNSGPNFVQATSVEEATRLLAAGSRVIAGGTDLVVAARSGRAILPASLVAIDRIDALRQISFDGTRLRIGAAVSHQQLVASPDINEHLVALADAAALVGSPATRHIGTVGGNIMNASPAADTGAPLLVAKAEVEVASTSGTRSIPLHRVWTGPGRTSISDDELCTAITVDVGQPGPVGTAYLRLEYRRAMEIAVVGAAAWVALDDDGAVRELRIGLSAIAPTIIEIPTETLDECSGQRPDAAAITAQAAARAVAAPISDTRASASYRTEMIGVVTRRAVLVAAGRAAGETIGVPANRHTGIGVALGASR